MLGIELCVNSLEFTAVTILNKTNGIEWVFSDVESSSRLAGISNVAELVVPMVHDGKLIAAKFLIIN